VSKPPITIKCECGESKEVAYGERWQCESCGRIWDTRQIPAVEYDGLLRRMRRVRLEAFVIAGLVAAVVIPLIVFVNTAIILLVPGVAAIWLFFYLPFWRRRARRAARQSPNWELHPEQSGADAPS
jgi:Flp pilus assembly protein TadB